jgi:RNA polymerase sigma-70 factor (ECF subfamily)
LNEDTPSGDADLILQFRKDPERAMPLIFERFYAEICRHIYRIIPVHETCEDIAQGIFMELWKKRRGLDIRTSLGAYLHKMALTRALNYLRDNRKHRHDPEEELTSYHADISTPLQELAADELQNVISKTIDALPPRCRDVFVLSRFEAMSYQEIAKALDISPKTVENQISKALLILRTAVQNYDRGKPE